MREYTEREWDEWKNDPKTEAFLNQLKDHEMRKRLEVAADVAQNVFHQATLNTGRADGMLTVIHMMERRP